MSTCHLFLIHSIFFILFIYYCFLHIFIFHCLFISFFPSFFFSHYRFNFIFKKSKYYAEIASLAITFTSCKLLIYLLDLAFRDDSKYLLHINRANTMQPFLSLTSRKANRMEMKTRSHELKKPQWFWKTNSTKSKFMRNYICFLISKYLLSLKILLYFCLFKSLFKCRIRQTCRKQAQT